MATIYLMFFSINMAGLEIIVLMVFNLVFSSSRDVYTGKYWIGKH